jgi:hypothetical protein
MPGYHLNGMITFAREGRPGKPYPAWIARDAPACGTLLLVSTRQQSLPFYEVWWSLELYIGGPMPSTWQFMGSVRDMYGYDLLYPGGLLGPDYMELWVMRNYRSGCDLYMRRSTTIPRERFTHFSINVSDPAFFFLLPPSGSIFGRPPRSIGRLRSKHVYRKLVWTWQGRVCEVCCYGAILQRSCKAFSSRFFFAEHGFAAKRPQPWRSHGELF